LLARTDEFTLEALQVAASSPHRARVARTASHVSRLDTKSPLPSLAIETLLCCSGLRSNCRLACMPL
jgi:hypothetical protein